MCSQDHLPRTRTHLIFQSRCRMWIWNPVRELCMRWWWLHSAEQSGINAVTLQRPSPSCDVHSLMRGRAAPPLRHIMETNDWTEVNVRGCVQLPGPRLRFQRWRTPSWTIDRLVEPLVSAVVFGLLQCAALSSLSGPLTALGRASGPVQVFFEQSFSHHTEAQCRIRPTLFFPLTQFYNKGEKYE